MQIDPTPEQAALIRHAIETGRLSSEEDAAREALALWEEYERRRAELLAKLDEAEASFETDEGILATPESMRKLAEDVKRRGQERLRIEGVLRE
jgi:Arc/MetJ-type ribon-helix-helix transcriptional regulator